MSVLPSNQPHTPAATSQLATIMLAIPPARRGAALLSVVSCRPNPTVDASFALGPLRAAFAEFWEDKRVLLTSRDVARVLQVERIPIPHFLYSIGFLTWFQRICDRSVTGNELRVLCSGSNDAYFVLQ